MRRTFRLPSAVLRRRLSTFYDSQSGREVTVPTGPQVHVGLTTVPIDRISSAMRHLLRPDSTVPIKGLASIPLAVVSSEDDVSAAAARKGIGNVCIDVADTAQGLAVLIAAKEKGLLPALAVLQPHLVESPHDVQLTCAELGDAGADAILLCVEPTMAHDDLREMADMACEIDLLGVPMRQRLGLQVKPGPDTLGLLKFAHAELEMLHFMSCLAGKAAPKPSELLKALGTKPADANFGSMFLAEFVPDAA